MDDAHPDQDKTQGEQLEVDSALTLSAELLDSPATQSALLALKFRLMAQAAPRKWKSGLLRIEERVRDGMPLEQAIQQKPTLPRDLQSLFVEACKVPDPGSLMMQAMNVQARIWREWREFAAVLVYPALLLVTAILIALGVHAAVYHAIDFGYIEDFQMRGADWVTSQWVDQQQAVIGVAVALAWVLFTAVTIYYFGPPWAWLAVGGAIAAIGKPLRWISLHEILERYRLFTAQRLTTTQVAVAVADSFQDSAQGAVASRLARQVENGVPLGKALGDCQLADSLCRPALYLLDTHGGELQDAMEQVSGLLESLAKQRCRTLRAILPLCILLLVTIVIWSLMASYLVMISSVIPLISLL